MTKYNHLNELKTQLNNFELGNKEVIEVKNNWLSFWSLFEDKLEKIEKLKTIIKTQFNKERIAINQDYSFILSSLDRSIEQTIEKNRKTIDSFQQNNDLKIKSLKNLNDKHIENLDIKLQDFYNKNKISNDKANNIYDIEINRIDNEIQKIRKTYLKSIPYIQNKAEDKIQNLRQKIDETTTISEEFTRIKIRDKSNYLNNYEIKKKIIDSESSKKIDLIKTNHTKLIININDQINIHKKNYNTNLLKLESLYNEKIEPLEKEFILENDKYSTESRLVLHEITGDLDELNQVFDFQKNQYETIKNDIIKEKNDKISVINTQLSILKDSIKSQKDKLTKDYRTNVQKSKNGEERQILLKEYNLKIVQLDNELNKSITRSHEEILDIQKVYQDKLYNHDIEHLNQMNIWRLRRTSSDEKRKYLLALLENKFNQSKTNILNKINHYKKMYEYEKQLLYIDYLKKLLPLESQIANATITLNRDQNIILDEKNIELIVVEHEKKLKYNSFDIEELKVNYENKKLIETLNYELHKLEASLQNSLEKEKVSRNISIQSQNILKTISNYNRNLRIAEANYDLDIAKTITEFNKTKAFEKTNFEINNIKNNIKFEYEKREYFINKAKHQHQKQQAIRRSQRIIELNVVDINEKNAIESLYFEALFNLISFKNNSINFIEKIKKFLNSASTKKLISFYSDLTNVLNGLFFDILSSLKDFDLDYYDNKIEDTFGYKIMKKHEDILTSHEKDKAVLNEAKNNILESIKNYENSLLQIHINIEKNHKLIENIIQSKDISKNEFSNLTSPYTFENKKYYKLCSQIESKISKENKKLKNIEKQYEQLLSKLKKQENKLDLEKRRVAFIFYKFKNIQNKIYYSLETKFRKFVDKETKFYNNFLLKDFINDNSFMFLEKFINNLYNNSKEFLHYIQQKNNQYMISLNNKIVLEQNIAISEYTKKTNKIINKISNSYKDYIKKYHDTHKASMESFKISTYNKNRFHEKELKAKKIIFDSELKSLQDILMDLNKAFTNAVNSIPVNIKVLNDNLDYLKRNIDNEYNLKLKQYAINYEKSLSTLIKQKNSYEQNFIETTNNINQHIAQVFNQYTIAKNKLIKSHSRKIANYAYDEKKIDSSMNKSTIILNKTAAKLDIDIKNHQKYAYINYKNKMLLLNKKHKNDFNKDIKTLKKSYKFKNKMLNKA